MGLSKINELSGQIDDANPVTPRNFDRQAKKELEEFEKIDLKLPPRQFNKKQKKTSKPAESYSDIVRFKNGDYVERNGTLLPSNSTSSIFLEDKQGTNETLFKMSSNGKGYKLNITWSNTSKSWQQNLFSLDE